MKSFTGKFTSVRGWALLLALLLGAGMMISACGDEEVPTPTTPAPTPPTPTPPAPEPTPEPIGPATPEYLRVSATTSSSITWMWDAVEGVLGYQGQFSPDATFADTDTTFLIVAPATSHTVSNLSGNMTGHFRVRSGTGTSITDLQYSEWTDGVSGSTAAPAPAAPLAAPESVSVSSRGENSIVITWDEVDDAATYEVGQSVDGGTWGPASCGDGGDDEVSTDECIATELTAGTDYDFRVRAVPADSDTDKYRESAWSGTLETSTRGRAPSEPVSGGVGDLNVRWASAANSITWIWDRVEGKKYDIFAAENTYAEDANPCKDRTYSISESSATSHSLDPAPDPGDIALLCVRTTNEQNLSENLSFAWAVAAPAAPSVASAPSTARDNDKDGDEDTTTALHWSGFEVKGGFNYEYRVAIDPHGANEIPNAVSPITASVRSACDDGMPLKKDESDVTFTDNNIILDGNLKKYAGYLLCTRYSNDAGESDWSVPADNTGAYTRPTAVPSPNVYSSLSGDDSNGTTTTVVWRVSTRGNAEVPRLSGGYTVRTIEHLERKANDGNDGTVGIKSPSTATCGIAAPSGDYTRTNVTDTNVSDDGDGIVIRANAAFARPAAYSTDTNNPTPPQDRIGHRKVYVCVQATSTLTQSGPWRLSGAYTVRQQMP